MRDWIDEGRRAAGRLLQTGERPSGNPGDTADRLKAFEEAEAAALPFVEEAPEQLRVLRDNLAGLLAGSADSPSVDDLVGDRESEAAREIRNLYRIALKIAGRPEAREVVVDLSANKAFRALESRFPDIALELTAHLQEFGWVRTVSTGLDILSHKEVLQRMQPALLRWNAETIALAADPPPAGAPEVVDDDLAEAVANYRSVADDIAFSPGLPVKAKWSARLLFGQVAADLQRPLFEVLNTPARDLVRALESGDGPSGRPAPAQLQGAAASRGRAVGRVRVVLDADEGGKVRVGDIIVTDLSTPTYEGQPSIFPYRTVPSVPIEKAAAIVADEGGLLSHAAIVCRENSVPSLLGTEAASQMLKDGMIVEVDATRSDGRVSILAG